MSLDSTIQPTSLSGAADILSALREARSLRADSGAAQNFTSRLPSSAGSRSDASSDSHSPGGETSVKLEQERDPATPSLAAATLPGGPVQVQVPGSAAGGQTRDLAGTQEAAKAATPAASWVGAAQSRALEPVEKSSEGEEGQNSGGPDSAQARAAQAYARAGSGAGASSGQALSRVA